MKKLMLAIFAICTCCIAQGNAETCLRDFFEVTYVESLQKEGFSINRDIQKKYQAVAKQFSAKGSTQTNVITYETTDTGVNVHIGWYSDGFIATALDGPEAGKQVIIINGSVVGVSYDIMTYNGYFTHTYTWAKVTSYSNYQILKW